MNDAPNAFILPPSCLALCNGDHLLSMKTEIYFSLLEATLDKRHLPFPVQASDGNSALPGERCEEEAGSKQERITHQAAWQHGDPKPSPWTSRPGSSTIRMHGGRQWGAI